MPAGDHVITISEIPSGRWDLALGRLQAGGPMVVLDCEPPVGIQRWVGWPGADGHVHVSIFTTQDPDSLTAEIAARDVASGLEYLRMALVADPRLGIVFDEYGVVRRYVYDYGQGAVAVGEVLEDGSVRIH